MDVLPDLCGLKITRTLWGLEPRWTIELDKDAIKEAAKAALHLPDHCSVYFPAKGALNKLYIITSAGNEVVISVTLPVYPKWKTLGEVTTLQWVTQNTSLPVPRVLAYNTDRSSPVGLSGL